MGKHYRDSLKHVVETHKRVEGSRESAAGAAWNALRGSPKQATETLENPLWIVIMASKKKSNENLLEETEKSPFFEVSWRDLQGPLVDGEGIGG